MALLGEGGLMHTIPWGPTRVKDKNVGTLLPGERALRLDESDEPREAAKASGRVGWVAARPKAGALWLEPAARAPQVHCSRGAAAERRGSICMAGSLVNFFFHFRVGLGVSSLAAVSVTLCL
jgi:hypothetical protein